MVTISIGKADTKCPEHVTLTSGMVNAVQVMFTFSDEWENFNKIAVFSNGDKTIDVSLDEDKCYIPHEVLAVPGNEVTVGVYGSKGEGDDYVAIPTEKCSLGEVVEGVDPSGEEPKEPTPSPWDDLQRRIKAIEDKMENGGDVEHEHAIATSVTNLTFTDLLKEGKLTGEEGTMGFDIKPTSIRMYATGIVTIDIKGHVTFRGTCSGTGEVRVDGVEITDSNTDFDFSGNVAEKIEIFAAGELVASEFFIEGKDGFMSSEHVGRLENTYTKDEIHNLIGLALEGDY